MAGAETSPTFVSALHYLRPTAMESYIDVEVLSGIDHGRLASNRFILASVSPMLKKAVADLDPNEDVVLITDIPTPEVQTVLDLAIRGVVRGVPDLASFEAFGIDLGRLNLQQVKVADLEKEEEEKEKEEADMVNNLMAAISNVKNEDGYVNGDDESAELDDQEFDFDAEEDFEVMEDEYYEYEGDAFEPIVKMDLSDEDDPDFTLESETRRVKKARKQRIEEEDEDDDDDDDGEEEVDDDYMPLRKKRHVDGRAKKRGPRSMRSFHNFVRDESKKFQCEKCEYGTDFKSNLTLHLLRHDRPSHEKYFCLLCRSGFGTQKELRDHKENTHSKPPQLMMKKEGEDFKKPLEEGNDRTFHSSTRDPTKKFQCDLCEYGSDFRSNFTLHYLRHTRPSSEKYFCLLCHEGFGTVPDLKYHKKFAHANDQHDCRFCDRSYKTRGRLEAHEAEHINEGLDHNDAEGNDKEMCTVQATSESGRIRVLQFSVGIGGRGQPPPKKKRKPRSLGIQ